jgi:hypothetical protein
LVESVGVEAMYRRYPRETSRLFCMRLCWGLFEGHPEYILPVPFYTFNNFTCICRSSVIASIHIALSLLVPHVTVLSCWSALTVGTELERDESKFASGSVYSVGDKKSWKRSVKALESLVRL